MSNIIMFLGAIVMIIAAVFLIHLTLEVEIKLEEMNLFMWRLIAVLTLAITGFLMIVLAEDTHVSKMNWTEKSPYLSNLE